MKEIIVNFALSPANPEHSIHNNSSVMKKLFLLDAYALIYRAYYALIRSPRVTSGGFNTSAIYGFVNTLDEVLRKEDPQYIAVCFDPPGGKTFRHEAYPEYKAQREKQPEDITAAVPLIRDILRASNIPMIEMANYEADDVIGTLATRASHQGYTTYMMTPDKDYGQLVSNSVYMYRPSLRGQGFEVRGPKEVCERYGISSPSQVIDLLALEGDASDNVPGCPGVGEKTAVKLINEFGSVESLLENTDKLKGALQKKVRDNAEQIRFSKFLVTIKTDVPIDVDLASLVRKEPDIDAMKKIYEDLEFRTLLSRLEARTIISTPLPPEPAAQPKAAPADGMGSLFELTDNDAGTSCPTPDITIADTPALVATHAAGAIAAGEAGVNICACGEEAMTAVLTGIGLAYGDHDVYIPVPDDKDLRREIMSMLQPMFEAPDITLVSHEVKRDMVVMAREGVAFNAPYFDTSVAHYLLKPDMKHTLETVALELLGRRMSSTDLTDLQRRKQALDPTCQTPERTAERARVTLSLRPALTAALDREGLTPLMRDIELPFVKVLASMEREGVRIDTTELAHISTQLTERLTELESRAYFLAGGPFNIGSPSQVGEILFGKMEIDPKAKKTKTGAWSTTEDILEKYRRDYEIVDVILKVRALRKLLTTYVDALPKLINPVTGKLHTTFNQTVTATGRISSTNPNLQNIPVRTDDGREIRRCFIPDEGCVMLAADYSQIELRLIADFSGDEAMIEAFASGEDIHRATAAKIYHLQPADVTADQRRNAKTANFGIIYGISAFGLSQRLDIPRSEAKMLIDGYMRSYPKVREYMDASIEHAREKGYVTTVMGRRRYLPDILSRNATVRGYAERNAINAPIQGSAADIIKKAMIAIQHEIEREGLRSRMILQVHDELVFNVFPDELPHLRDLVVRHMSHAYSGKVALDVSAGTGSNWLEAH